MKSPGFGFLFVLLSASAAVMVFRVKQVSASDSADYYVSGQSVNGTHYNTHEDVKSLYKSVDFAQESQWDEFLKAYLRVEE